MLEGRYVKRLKDVYLEPCSNVACPNERDDETDDAHRWISLAWAARSTGAQTQEVFCCWACVREWTGLKVAEPPDPRQLAQAQARTTWERLPTPKGDPA